MPILLLSTRLLLGEDSEKTICVLTRDHLADSKISYCILKCELSSYRSISNGILMTSNRVRIAIPIIVPVCTLRLL